MSSHHHKEHHHKKETHQPHIPTSLPNSPRLVHRENARFLVFEEPSDELLPLFIDEFKRYHVKHVVSACSVSYDVSFLQKQGFQHHEFKFTDGAAPPDEVIKGWVELVFSVFEKKGDDNEAIGVHCAAGLGRAPVLVAIALIEQGADPLEAVSIIRETCPGAINTPQLKFLQAYKRKFNKKCCIM